MTQKESTIGLQSPDSARPTDTHREVSGERFRLRLYRVIRKLLLGFILVSVINVLFSYLFLTPKMYRINRDNRELMIKYRILQERIRTAQQHTDEIRHRDNHVYRTLFSSDTLSLPAVWQPYGDEKYAALQEDPFASLMVPTWKQLDHLARTLYLESRSFDELQQLSSDKEQMTLSIPAIWPIDRSELRGSIGAFNPHRFHPILKRIQPHNGVDFGCRRGTPIYATGDGVVEKAQTSGYNGGYGRQVVLNHGFGYKTRYAHLDKPLVARGDTVRRGQLIGLAGNTGRSTSSHLHYEVIYKGRPVNPVNYFNRHMTEEEYERLMEQMRDTKFEAL